MNLQRHIRRNFYKINAYTWTVNKVRELATVCLPWLTGQKPWYGLMTLTYQRFTVVLLLIYGSLFLSGIY